MIGFIGGGNMAEALLKGARGEGRGARKEMLVSERLDLDGGGLYAIGEDGSTLSMAASQDLPAHILPNLTTQSVVEGVTGYAAKTQEPVVLKVADYPPYLPYRSVFEAAQVACVVYVPLLFRDTLEGLLMLVSCNEPDGSSLTPGLLESLGRHIGSAVGNAKELERARQTEARYRSAVETVKDVLYQALPSGSLLFISPRAEELGRADASSHTRRAGACGRRR